MKSFIVSIELKFDFQQINVVYFVNIFFFYSAPRFQMKTKSPSYLKAETALLENKRNIFRFHENSSLIKKFRDEAMQLTLELTHEIQNEFKQLNNQTYQRLVGKFRRIVLFY